MFHLVLMSSFLALSYGLVPPNSVAYKNNVIVMTLDLIDDNLAHTIKDASNHQKRAFSIIAEATLLYVLMSSDPHDVVRELHDLLAEPADVIAADPKKDLDYLKAIIAQPVNDIKRACKFNTSDMACVEILEYYDQQQQSKCPEYQNHVQLRDDLENLIIKGGVSDYLYKAISESKRGSDISAIGFFLEYQAEREDVFDRIRDVYNELSAKKYPCRSFGLYDTDLK